jgi:hypothetical protein
VIDFGQVVAKQLFLPFSSNAENGAHAGHYAGDAVLNIPFFRAARGAFGWLRAGKQPVVVAKNTLGNLAENLAANRAVETIAYDRGITDFNIADLASVGAGTAFSAVPQIMSDKGHVNIYAKLAKSPVEGKEIYNDIVKNYGSLNRFAEEASKLFRGKSNAFKNDKSDFVKKYMKEPGFRQRIDNAYNEYNRLNPNQNTIKSYLGAIAAKTTGLGTNYYLQKEDREKRELVSKIMKADPNISLEEAENMALEIVMGWIPD